MDTGKPYPINKKCKSTVIPRYLMIKINNMNIPIEKPAAT